MIRITPIYYRLSIIHLLIAALLSASCSGDKSAPLYNDDRITFGAESDDGWNDITRATILTKELLHEKGFGVFAYYTKKDTWSEFDKSIAPNFMNNTKVTSDNNGVAWDYSPLKYWPHDKQEKVSFFAYAPYNELYSIEGTRMVYNVPQDIQQQSDLCWSITDTDDLSYGTVGNDKITFRFRHALAGIGFTVQAQANGSSPLPDGMSIRIKKITLTSSTDNTGTGIGALYTKGKLELDNEANDAVWYDCQGAGKYTVSQNNFVGKAPEGFLLDKDNTDNKKTLNINDSYIMVIPQDFTSEGFNIVIEYDVILEKGENIYSTYTNVGTGNIKTDLESGKIYTINITVDLNKTTVELVSVTEWKDGGEVVLPGLVA